MSAASGEYSESSVPGSGNTETKDITLLVLLSDQLGGLEAVSDFVCNATVVRDYPRDFDTLVTNLVAFQVGQWKMGNAQPHLYRLTANKYEEDARTKAVDYFSREIADAEISLSLCLDEVGEHRASTANELLTTLGIMRTEEGFQVIDHDANRATALEGVAKLMNPGYREFSAINPGLAAMLDPTLASELAGREAENPTIRQLYRELRYEV